MENSCWVNCCRFQLLCPAPGFTAYWLSLTLPVPQVPNYDINKVTLPDTGLLEDHILYDRDVLSPGPDTMLTRTVSDHVCLLEEHLVPGGTEEPKELASCVHG